LYLGSAVLKYYQDQGQLASDLPYVHWSLQTALYETQKAFDDFFDNFPQRWLGRMLRFVIFPLGRSYKAPSDSLGHTIASNMMEQTELRDRMTNLCYFKKNADDIIGRLENAFQLILATVELKQKITQAIRDGVLQRQEDIEVQLTEAVTASVLTAQEAQRIREAEAARRDAEHVDEFSLHHFKRTEAK
jgi:acyl-CoA dehydrogenase